MAYDAAESFLCASYSWQGGLWTGRIGYASYLRRLHPQNMRCYGKYGVDYACEYHQIFFVFSSVGVEKAGSEAGINKKHAQFIRAALERSNAPWKVRQYSHAGQPVKFESRTVRP